MKKILLIISLLYVFVGTAQFYSPEGSYDMRAETLVDEASDLQGILSSEVVYYLDGFIDMDTIRIHVPPNGLFIKTPDYFVGGLFSTADNYTMFVNETGTYAGNFRMSECSLYASGVNSKLFDLDNQQNSGAIEFNGVNIGDFQGATTEIGELANYRQLRTADCGFFRIQDGLTFTGTWSGGFSIVDTIVLAQGANSTLFKAGVGLTFGGRCLSNINAASVSPTTITFDFAASNFLLNGGFQLSGASFAPNSSISVTTDETELSSYFRNNIEIKNTHVRALTVSDTQVVNTLTVNVPEKVEGTSVETYSTWMSTSNNRVTIDTSLLLDVEVYYSCRIDAGPNDEVAISIRYYDASANTFTTVSRQVRNVANVIGGLDIVDFDINDIVQQVTIGDYFEPFIENTTDGSDATVQTGAKLKVIRI